MMIKYVQLKIFISRVRTTIICDGGSGGRLNREMKSTSLLYFLDFLRGDYTHI